MKKLYNLLEGGKWKYKTHLSLFLIVLISFSVYYFFTDKNYDQSENFIHNNSEEKIKKMKNDTTLNSMIKSDNFKSEHTVTEIER